MFACGKGAALSHESAACLWSLSPDSPPYIHVTVPGYGGRAKREGIFLHYSATLGGQTTLRHNIPVTTRERTLADLGWDREPTRSHLERVFLRLVRRSGLPDPEVNARVGPYRVDFLWRSERLVVELDGYAYHSSRASFESDRRRDRELQARGYAVLRFTYGEVAAEPDAVIAHLRQRM